MSMSLREQLLAAGLVTKKQVQQAEQQQRPHRKDQKGQKKSGAGPTEEQKRLAAQQAAKAARDQELNRKREENAVRKARHAEIRQLIEQHRLPKPETEEYFNFIDRQKVRRQAVDAPLREKLIAGEVFIVRCEGRYDFVPKDIAERIRERDERAVISLDAKPADVAENDPYKDFVVPDDLKW